MAVRTERRPVSTSCGRPTLTLSTRGSVIASTGRPEALGPDRPNGDADVEQEVGRRLDERVRAAHERRARTHVEQRPVDPAGVTAPALRRLAAVSDRGL